jgi:hypothetical protein
MICFSSSICSHCWIGIAGVAETIRQRSAGASQSRPSGFPFDSKDMAGITTNISSSSTAVRASSSEINTSCSFSPGRIPVTETFDSGRNRLCQIGDGHAGDLRYEDFTAMHLLDTADDETYTLFERNPETGHALVSDGDTAIAALLDKHRHNTASAADHVSIAHAAHQRFFSPE